MLIPIDRNRIDVSVSFPTKPTVAPWPIVHILYQSPSVAGHMIDSRVALDAEAVSISSMVPDDVALIFDIVIVNDHGSESIAASLRVLHGNTPDAKDSRALRLHRNVAIAAGEEWSYRQATGRTGP